MHLPIIDSVEGLNNYSKNEHIAILKYHKVFLESKATLHLH